MAGPIAMSESFILFGGTLALLLMVVALIIFSILFQKKLIEKEVAYRQIQKLLDDQEIKSAYAVLEGQEKERKRIAQDLHDNMGSILAVLKLYVYNLVDSEAPAENEASKKVMDLMEKAIAENRRIAYDLDAIALKHFGLEKAIDELCNALNKSKRLVVTPFLQLKAPLESDLSFQLYRIIQELFNNTLKHADATRVSLSVETIDEAYLSVIYEDDGKGYDTRAVKSKGMGLKSIEARLNLFQGKFNVESSPGIGTTVVLEVPLQHT